MHSFFLQSPEWEEFQKSLGRKTWRIESALVIQHILPGGFNYLYIPRPEIQATEVILRPARKIADKERSIFLKIDPVSEVTLPHISHCATESLQPQETVIVNLEKNETGLLGGMHEKTRYNIRLAKKRGVEVTPQQPTTKNLDIFWRLLSETAERDGFHPHKREHYEKLLQIRTKNFSNELFFATYRDEILAAALINFYAPAKTALYMHGASTRSHRSVMAPQLLHWTILNEAKSRGFTHYDFGGINEQRWPGVTRFKIGFGGTRVKYPASFDILYRPAAYALYCALKALKKNK